MGFQKQKKSIEDNRVVNQIRDFDVIDEVTRKWKITHNFVMIFFWTLIAFFTIILMCLKFNVFLFIPLVLWVIFLYIYFKELVRLKVI
jgi:hypothetical protein